VCACVVCACVRACMCVCSGVCLSAMCPSVYMYVYVQCNVLTNPSFPTVMIVSWYQFSIFNSDSDDGAVTSDVAIINDLNAELDWWEYQRETWLAIGA